MTAKKRQAAIMSSLRNSVPRLKMKSGSMNRLRTLLAMLSATLVLNTVLPESSAANETPANYQDWKHSGSMWLLTTPDGADLPDDASVEGFPTLVRLHRDFFDFR